MNAKAKALNQRNNELDKRLNKANNSAMTDIVCYLRAANISEYHQEIVRQDLLQMVLSAQERGEDMKTVIGEDYRSFCDEVIAALPKKNIKERILEMIDMLLLCTAIFAAISIVLSQETFELIRNALTGREMNFQISISLGGLLRYAVIFATAFLTVQVICRNALKPAGQQKHGKLVKFVAGGAIGGGIMAVFLLIAWLFQQTLFTVNILGACLFALGLYLAHKLLQKLAVL